jgi:hypothetical protein
MTEPQVLSTLRRKRDEIENAIAAYRAKIEEAERDHAAIVATICLFETRDGSNAIKPWADLSRLWKRGEIVQVCRAALEAEGPLDTRELALRVIRAKGLDESDRLIRRAVAYRIVQALGIAAKRQKIVGMELRKGVRVWC